MITVARREGYLLVGIVVAALVWSGIGARSLGTWALEVVWAVAGLVLVLVVGITAYRAAFDRPQATLGARAESLAGSRLWVLPNPSGLNAHYQPPALAAAFAELRTEALGDG